MKKDGIASLFIFLFVCFLVGKLTHMIAFVLFFGLTVTGSVYLVSAGSAYVLLSIGGKLNEIKNQPKNTITTLQKSDDFQNTRYKIHQLIAKNGDRASDVSKKFLWLIDAIQPHQEVPMFLINGILKKMLYEHFCRYGNIGYSLANLPKGGINVNDVMRPISKNEQREFFRFCIVHD